MSDTDWENDFQTGQANVEISIDADKKVVWLKLQAGTDVMELGIPVNHAFGISQALAGACNELGYEHKKSAN